MYLAKLYLADTCFVLYTWDTSGCWYFFCFFVVSVTCLPSVGFILYTYCNCNPLTSFMHGRGFSTACAFC